MEIKEAIDGRRSVREYEPEATDGSVIHRLIAAAVKARSAVNQQPWTFTVVRDRELLERISRKAKAHVLATSAHVAQADDFRALLSDPDFHIFYRAPVLIVISAAAHGPWIVEDCALAAEMMLSAFAEHAVASRDMRYLADRIRTAQLVPPPAEFSAVAFGHRVAFRRDDGRLQAFRIVGEDEADPRNGSISYVSPVARALIGRAAGDIVLAGDHEIEILSID